MGELSSEGDVLAVEERSNFGSSWMPSTSADSASISKECLSAAEEAAEEVLNCVHPTLDAEEKRRDVIDYVQQLVKIHLNSEVIDFLSLNKFGLFLCLFSFYFLQFFNFCTC